MTHFPINRSIITRLVVWVVIIAVVVIQLLWFLTDTSIRRASDEAIASAVDADLAILMTAYDEDGVDALAGLVEERLSRPTGMAGQAHYLLVREGEDVLAGDIAQWPQLDTSGTTRTPDGTRLYARVARPEEKLRLVVARELTGGEALLSQAAVAFFLGGAAIIILVGLSGLVTAQRLARRIDRINDAFRGPDPKMLAALAQDPGANDEIGELTQHSAASITRINRLLTEQRELSDRVAHEMRTPLVHLDNRLVKAVRAAEDPEKAADLRGARADLKEVVDLLESVLDISANEARRGDLSGLEEVDLTTLVTRICEMYFESVEEAGLTLRHDIAPDVRLPGEEMQLARVFTNLLDNAMKYVPEGGTITVRLERGPVLHVADDGPGIPESARATIFERFRRGAMKFNASRGAGLGLALARSIAERHGLTLTLEPSQKGAHFRMGTPRDGA